MNFKDELRKALVKRVEFLRNLNFTFVAGPTKGREYHLDESFIEDGGDYLRGKELPLKNYKATKKDEPGDFYIYAKKADKRTD